MKAIQGQFKDGVIHLKEPAPDNEQTDVLVIFPGRRSHKNPSPEELENEFQNLFGIWEDWWDDDMDNLMRQAFAGRPDVSL